MIDPTSASSSSPTSGTGSSSSSGSVLGKDDFLRLMMAQLQNQDPTNPTDDTQYTAELAQFSTLEQITNLAATSEASASNDYDQQAVDLIGRTVSYVDDNGATQTGRVGSVTFTSTGPTLTIGDQTGILPVTVTAVTTGS